MTKSIPVIHVCNTLPKQQYQTEIPPKSKRNLPKIQINNDNCSTTHPTEETINQARQNKSPEKSKERKKKPSQFNKRVCSITVIIIFHAVISLYLIACLGNTRSCYHCESPQQSTDRHTPIKEDSTASFSYLPQESLTS
jgi:hypothetical protein